jgi:hypothetical protein
MESSVISQSAPVGAGSGSTATNGRWARIAGAPYLRSLVACIILALISGAVLPTVPSYDPWSWIVWGREVFDPHLSLIIGGGSSWKPFPVFFTAVYGLFSGAPTMWVITERAGALMAFIAAYRLAAQMTVRIGFGAMAGDGHDLWRYLPVIAGVISAFCLILLQDFAYYFYRGASEPILVGCALWAVDRFVAGKRGQAFALGVALGLMRPEVWPLMIVYAAWLVWKTEPAGRVKTGLIATAGLAFMPFMWFAPTGITTGKWFSAATQASDYPSGLGAHPLIAVLRRGVDDQSVPVLVLALIAIGITLYKERDRLILGCAGLGLAWWIVVEIETAKGYPGLERFYLPAAAIACVLAGVGVIRIGALIAELAGRVGAALTVRRTAAVLASLIAVAISYHYVDGRVTYTKDQYSLTKVAVTRLNNLSAAVAAVGGHNGVFPCKSKLQSYTSVNHSLQTALAFKLHSTLERVGTVLAYPGVLFVGPHDSIDGGLEPPNPYFTRTVFLKQVGMFKMYRVYRAGQSLSCVGT